MFFCLYASSKRRYILSPDPLGPQLLLQGALILVNAFFAGTELAVLSVSEGSLRKQAEAGDKTSAKLLKIAEDSSDFLSTIQVCITLAGFLGSAFAADNFASRIVDWLVGTCGVTAIPEATLNTIAVIAVTIILSFFTLILGELVPKRVAMHAPEKWARFACGVVNAMNKLLKPIIWLLSKTTNGVLRLMGINPDEDTEDVSESQIRMMVDIGEEKGAIESTERDLIENIFEFNNVTAFDAMIHRTDMVVIYEEDTDEEILKTIKESGLSRFPVCGEDVDDILGILRTREYLINSLAENPKPLRDIIAPAYFVPETVKADVLFRDMQAKKVQFAIVLDEFGGTSGLVTMEDLVEEVFGNIYDEFDLHEDLPLEKIGDNLWRAAGTLELETLFEELEMPYEESEDYSTLGGLVFSQFSVIPADGTNPETDVMGLHIRVEELREHRIEWTTISKLPDPDEEKDARERLDELLNK